MYSQLTITNLLQLVGWRAWHNSDVPSLTAANTTTDSGLFYNDSGSLVNLKNIYACMPEGHTLDTYLTQLKTDVINNSLEILFKRKNLDRQTKDLLSDNYLFNGPGRVANKVQKEGRFVGFEIQLSLYQGIKAEIDEIWTQVDTIQNPLTIYVFHSSKLDPVKTIDLNLTKINEVERHVLTDTDIIELYYVSNNNSPGGYYYLGYFEDDLTGLAINRDAKFLTDCCGTNFVSQRRGYFESITPFNVSSSDLNGTQIWDEISVNRISNNNYGLNIRTSVKCDLTEFITRNKQQLTTLLKTVMKQFILDLYMNSNNINHIQGLSAEKVAYFKEEMNKNKEIEKAIEEVNFNFEGHSPCFPPVRRNTVRHTSL